MLESRFFPAPPHPAEGLGVSRHLFDVGDEIFHKQGGHASCEDRCESSRSESVVTGPVDQDVADSASTSGSIEAPSHRRRQEDGRRWLAAVNDRISELIARIQPTRQADVRRANIVEYVRHLTQRCFDCQRLSIHHFGALSSKPGLSWHCQIIPKEDVVFTFGSVPLKTYLPLGDIDLTIFCQIQAVKDIWAYELKRVLDSEMRNPGALYKVTGVVLIEAKVDRLIRRDHLFKQSVILVKAWACYESHIIGANQGLLSTYALEILLLYIFQIYHANLCSPLQARLEAARRPAMTLFPELQRAVADTDPYARKCAALAREFFQMEAKALEASAELLAARVEWRRLRKEIRFLQHKLTELKDRDGVVGYPATGAALGGADAPMEGLFSTNAAAPDPLIGARGNDHMVAASTRKQELQSRYRSPYLCPLSKRAWEAESGIL
eukprot:SM000028S10220  [mRNA]  locus=s28:895877:899293:- [translate_table: standard]